MSAAVRRALERVVAHEWGDGPWSAVDPFTLERYGNVPPEAFPFLDSRADGCHYALWIDDPSIDAPPPVVWVSPMDGPPETVRLVAADVERFEALVRSGLWRDGDDAERFAREAAEARAGRVTHATKDGMGVVLTRDEPALSRPADEVLVGPEGSLRFARAVRDWLDAGAPGIALAVARDLLAARGALAVPGFADRLGDIYDALGRPRLAAVARAAYR